MPDFNASVLDMAVAEMPDILTTKATLNPELNKRPLTQAALIQNQTATVEPIMGASGVDCVGLRAWYYVSDNDTVSTGSATPLIGECEITGGDTISTAKQEYALNYFDKQKIRINSKDCDNYAKFATKLAFAIPHKMHQMVMGFNNNTISELEAHKSVAFGDTPEIVGIDLGTGEYTITGSQYWTTEKAADTLAALDLLASMKGLPANYIIVTGKAFAVPQSLAAFKTANDNQRSYALQFGSRDIFNDVDNFDTLIGAEALFLVDPNVVLSYFHSEYPKQGQQEPRSTGDKNNTVEFALPLQFFDMYQDGSTQTRNVMFANDGMLIQAWVDIRYQIECNVVNNKNGKPSEDHVFEISLESMFDFAPAPNSNYTGILRVDKAL